MIRQRTIKMLVKATGVGVHNGEKVLIALRPAPVNTGIVFRRVDLNPVVEIPAHAHYIGDTHLSSCLVKDQVRISTVEHLMSALFGLGIDNLYIDLNASEVPIMDGSAAPFIFLIQSAGITEQNAPKKFFRIKQTLSVQEDEKFIRIKPFNGFKVDLKIDFDHPLFNQDNQHLKLDFSTSSYHKEVARARTFGFLADYEYIRKNNLSRGASLDNVVVLDQFKVMNDDGLRYHNEPLKHKMLDIIGDLYLLGHSVLGEIEGYKTGHALNGFLLRKILAMPEAFEIVTFEDRNPPPLLWFSQNVQATD